jgi:hypothetical protein
MAEPRVPAGFPGRAARYKRWAVASLKLLSNEELDVLRRARAGAPPGFILGPLSASDANLVVEDALNTIEQISRKLLGAYEWPEYDCVHYPRSGFVDDFIGGNWRPIDPNWVPVAKRSKLRYSAAHDQICPHYEPVRKLTC